MTRGILTLGGALALGLATATPAFAVEKVTGYVSATVRTYTEQGEPNGEVSKDTLPPNGGEVVGRNSRGYPGITVRGKTVYLRTSDVFVTDDSVAPRCTELAVNAKPAGSALAATGVRSGAAKTAVACIPTK